MSEKGGFTGKLKYDFDTAGNLEVFIPNLDGWYRVTSREFRSFNGKRRRNGESYDGPIYMYNTNKRTNKSTQPKHKIAGWSWENIKRGNEKF